MRTPVDVARELIGAPYCFWEEACNPPDLVNCYIFTAWVYRQCGIWLPVTLAGQAASGIPVTEEGRSNDLVLIQGTREWLPRPEDGAFVHVGIYADVGEQTLVHASGNRRCVVEEPLADILQLGDTVHVRRLARVHSELSADTPRVASLP
ncbi:MAG: hypothetical protein WD850_01760 [Candidatus Spechtbacterales bacterium]